MRKKIFMFLTSDGITFSSCKKTEPDVDNFQVLGWAEGCTEEDAFHNFVNSNRWILETDFEEVISVEVKSRVHEGKVFSLDDFR